MSRHEIIEIIGKKYLVSNVENDEYSYLQAFNKAGKDFSKIKISDEKGRGFQKIDIRFCDEQRKFVILVETKDNFHKNLDNTRRQLDAYVTYEKDLTGYTILSIIANTSDNRIQVYKGHVNKDNQLTSEKILKSFDEYYELILPKYTNNRQEIMQNTYELNELLHGYGINERLRGQFVGTCLLAIKNNLSYSMDMSTNQINAGIKEILGRLLTKDSNKNEKLTLINNKILESQDIKSLLSSSYNSILNFIKDKIFPFIN